MTDNNMNPWHSRPIDVHRWSDHPEVKELVDKIWDGVASNENSRQSCERYHS